MPTDTPALVADPELVTPQWLTEILRHGSAIDAGTRVVGVEASVIGTGQVGANVRYRLRYDGDAPGAPATIVGKFSSRDPQSAAAGVVTRTYETEVAFYRELAPTVAVSRPHCYFAALEPGTANVVVVMEDLAPAEQGDQIAGCSVEEAALAVDEAAKLHGPRWGDPTLMDLSWLDRSGDSALLVPMLQAVWAGFVDRYRPTLHDVTLEVMPRLMASIEAILTYEPVALTPIHYDYRLDNMLLGHPGRPLVVVDWQTVRLGMGPSDVAYFLGNAFDPPVRRSCEEQLVERYHDALLGYGVTGYSQARCWDEYRRSAFASLLAAVFSSMIVGRTERGDEMFMAMANRSAQMAVDLDTLALFGRS